MRVLHYSLGLEKYRGGGLSKYANDLAAAQSKQGHTVYYCWPGRLRRDKRVSLIQHKLSERLISCELVNPLPVPGLMGIRDVDMYTEMRDITRFIGFLKQTKPDVLHLHTIMGLPFEALRAARELGVPVVFTVHDYFGICPRASLYNYERECNCGKGMRPSECASCSQDAFSWKQLAVQQSSVYRAIKTNRTLSSIIRSAWKSHASVRTAQLPGQASGANEFTGREHSDVDYPRLLEYYNALFSMVDCALYNSEQTKTVFSLYDVNMPGFVLPVTHPGIADHRTLHIPRECCLRIAYLSSCDPMKGLPTAVEAVRTVRESGYNVTLNVYNDDVEECDGVVRKGSFTTSDLERIFMENDCSITPSIWRETFSFTTLESLSYGLPAIVTDTIGARYLVEGDQLGVVYDGSASALDRVLRDLCDDIGELVSMSRRICACTYLPLSYEGHLRKVLDVYKEVIG